MLRNNLKGFEIFLGILKFWKIEFSAKGDFEEYAIFGGP